MSAARVDSAAAGLQPPPLDGVAAVTAGLGLATLAGTAAVAASGHWLWSVLPALGMLATGWQGFPPWAIPVAGVAAGLDYVGKEWPPGTRTRRRASVGRARRRPRSA